MVGKGGGLEQGIQGGQRPPPAETLNPGLWVPAFLDTPNATLWGARRVGEVGGKTPERPGVYSHGPEWAPRLLSLKGPLCI